MPSLVDGSEEVQVPPSKPDPMAKCAVMIDPLSWRRMRKLAWENPPSIRRGVNITGTMIAKPRCVAGA